MLRKDLEIVLNKIDLIQTEVYDGRVFTTVSCGTQNKYTAIKNAIAEHRFYDACVDTWSILRYHLSHSACVGSDLAKKLRPLYVNLRDILDELDAIYPQKHELSTYFREQVEQHNLLSIMSRESA